METDLTLELKNIHVLSNFIKSINSNSTGTCSRPIITKILNFSLLYTRFSLKGALAP